MYNAQVDAVAQSIVISDGIRADVTLLNAFTYSAAVTAICTQISMHTVSVSGWCT